MEIVLEFETKDLQKMKEILLKDDMVSRASVTFREAKDFGGEGYYCYISGTDEQCKKAIEMTKEIAKELKNRDKVISKIKQEQDKATEGLGGIFG